MEKFVDFMSGKKGQLLRIIVGVALVVVAFVVANAVAQWILGILGVFFVFSGGLKVCLFNLFIGRRFTAVPKES